MLRKIYGLLAAGSAALITVIAILPFLPVFITSYFINARKRKTS